MTLPKSLITPPENFCNNNIIILGTGVNRTETNNFILWNCKCSIPPIDDGTISRQLKGIASELTPKKQILRFEKKCNVISVGHHLRTNGTVAGFAKNL